MSGDYIMCVKSIGTSKVGGRKPCTLESAAKHNKRELVQELEARGRIDGDRVALNYSIAGAGDVAAVIALALQLMTGIGTSPDKMRRDYCQAIEIVFSLPASTKIDTAHYFAACVEWSREQFGEGNILSADVHLDEAAPHCHILIAPIQDGRWVGSRLIDRYNTQAMRESFGRQVASVYGLRMVDKLTGCRKADAVAMVLADIETTHRGVITSTLWQPLRQAIERSPEPFIASMGIELPDRPPKKMKPFVDYVVSTGKGPKRETLYLRKSNPIGIEPSTKPTNPIGCDGQVTVRKSAPANPIGIENGSENHQSLSCVGFAFPKRRFATESIASQDRHQEPGRTVERDDCEQWIDTDGVIHMQEPESTRSNSRSSTRTREAATDEDGITRERDYIPDDQWEPA
jgi:hypothetical protein